LGCFKDVLIEYDPGTVMVHKHIHPAGVREILIDVVGDHTARREFPLLVANCCCPIAFAFQVPLTDRIQARQEHHHAETARSACRIAAEIVWPNL
jgi:hypothetical protein